MYSSTFLPFLTELVAAALMYSSTFLPFLTELVAAALMYSSTFLPFLTLWWEYLRMWRNGDTRN